MDQSEPEEAPTEEQRLNNFSNDGSFIEQFRKMQEQTAKEEQDKKDKMATEKAQLSKPLFSRVTKTKPVVIKFGGFRKKLLPGAKLNKPRVKDLNEDKQTGMYCIHDTDTSLHIDSKMFLLMVVRRRKSGEYLDWITFCRSLIWTKKILKYPVVF